MTAIVIDDDSAVANTFAEYLTMNNVCILGIGYDGKDAVELYQRFRPDVVFLDLMMPEYDGFYGLEKIKQLNQTSKVVMVTADPTNCSSAKMQRLGADMILYKPFELDAIHSAILRLIRYGVVS